MLASRHLLRRVSPWLGLRLNLLPASRIVSSKLLHASSTYKREVSMGGDNGHVSMEETQANIQDPVATVSSVLLLPSTAMMQVEWRSGGTDMFPYVWLRDNCQCPACFHPVSRSRSLTLAHLSLSVTPSTTQVSEDGGGVEVEWSDGHLSAYPATWLRLRAFNTHQQQLRASTIRLKEALWGCELSENLPEASFPELLEDDRALLRFLQQLEVVGLVFVTDTPTQQRQLHRLAHRVTNIKKTNYGETFLVHNKPDPNNLAYTSVNLDMHCDLPYMAYKPGVQLLHCISQFPGPGGSNMFADSFHGGKILRSLHPLKFNILASTPVDFIDVGVEDDQEYHFINQEPLISVHNDGEMKTVNLNNMVRDSFFRVPPLEVNGWYEALLTFRDILYDPQNCITYKMKAGDMVIFDNLRVLHGREGFPPGEGERLLEGCYWDWDGVRSRRRVLQSKLLT